MRTNPTVHRLLCSAILLALGAGSVLGDPRQISTSGPSDSYRVGDTIDPLTFVLDRDMQVVRLVDLIRPSTALAVLIVFGGAAKQVPRGAFRGNLWCLDSFDDLGVQRALVSFFQDKAVQFIPVAVPPVYDPASYGYAENIFLGKAENSRPFRDETRSFIDATEKEIKAGMLPFAQVYYDSKFYLGHWPDNTQQADHPWQGRLRWFLDRRQYGTPILWLLGPQGEILREPFFGNDYDSRPPRISYGYHEVKEAIERQLENLSTTN